METMYMPTHPPALSPSFLSPLLPLFPSFLSLKDGLMSCVIAVTNWLNHFPPYRFCILQLESAKKESAATPPAAQENLLGLIDAFVINPARSLDPSSGGGEQGGEDGSDRFLNPLEEVQLLLTIHTRLEEQENAELRYCIFDTIFSEAADERKVSVFSAGYKLPLWGNWG